MKLLHLEINKLFGLLDYEIPLNNHEITMLTGPNGYGKTMILKIINGILANELNILCKLKFGFIKINFQGGSVSISHDTEKDSLILNHLENSSGNTTIEKLKLQKNKPSMEDVFYIHWHEGEAKSKQKSQPDKPLSSKVLSHITSKEDVSFICADRLQVKADDETVIDLCARKLKNLMESAQDDSAALSQKLDATFPIRLFERLEQQKRFSSGNIQERLNGIQDKRRHYMRYGLIQAENDLMPEKSTSLHSSNEYLGVLDLYIEDALGKLSPFQILHQKIDLFESILQEKILAFKKVMIDRDNGFFFESSNGDFIDRNMLSSGEQNQIVLLFNLIFDLVSQKVILIDEPEISLHVAWQQTFLDSLKKMQKINKYEKVIIATHSPQVISKNWELTYDLYEMIKNKNESQQSSEGNE
ncbi:AAA family ATPase [Morganella morganii]|uniref:AAA family ATPase n=1 Tax=Morganella morganii TaxID=582 RepID=UPI001E168EC2|nr:AAA family ATPase [Morganella morganii]HDT4952556.1 AAA family ATPase [Morganella morganii subsp. morganii]EKU4287755.1 AAA family ATPase [Morganella morganii]EKU4303269.1 AAA family ATPase [Morganella morganii]EKU5663537.1 AAA family ATPase [Morganella morganii]EKU5690882.1 AAA family ATPase [Morganella morganii]